MELRIRRLCSSPESALRLDHQRLASDVVLFYRRWLMGSKHHVNYLFLLDIILWPVFLLGANGNLIMVSGGAIKKEYLYEKNSDRNRNEFFDRCSS